jgi:type IVB pilus formation R64 PilN family outer membrane protein
LEASDAVTLISNRPITLFEVGDMIGKTTSLKVRYAPQLEKEVVKTATDNPVNFDNIGADWAEPTKMIVSYRGPLSGLLDEIASRFGIWWKYEDREVYFYKYVTRTFVVYSLPTKSSLGMNIGGTSENEGGRSSLTLANTAELELWTNLESSIKSMIDEGSKYSMDSSNGTISLTATPSDIKKVAKFINEQNARLTRQVAVSVKVLQFTVEDSDQYGFNMSAMFTDGLKDSTGAFSSGTNLGFASAAGVQDLSSNLTMSIFPRNWDITAAIQALSTQGNVSLVTSGTVTTLNNKPAPIQVVRSEKYISEITKTNSGGDGDYYDVSTETEDIETGFTMDLLPRILEHGRLMLLFNLTLSDLLSLEKVYLTDTTDADAGGGQYIQNPIIESRGFTQEVAMKTGESLVLAGYERVETEANKTGIGSATNSLLGGTAEASRRRTVLVIIITPVVLDSPITPESRMRNI